MKRNETQHGAITRSWERRCIARGTRSKPALALRARLALLHRGGALCEAVRIDSYGRTDASPVEMTHRQPIADWRLGARFPF
jgi:hypothetical protein